VGAEGADRGGRGVGQGEAVGQAGVVQVLGQVRRERGQDHPGRRAAADPPLRGDQGGQAGRIPAGQAIQVQDQAQVRG
jgi:hypothetical protein